MPPSISRKDSKSNLEDVGMLYVESILDPILTMKPKVVSLFIEIMLGFLFGSLGDFGETFLSTIARFLYVIIMLMLMLWDINGLL